jgi:hypothetical protein
VSTEVGLIVLAAIFAFGVVVFGLFAITLLPAAVFLDEQIEAIRRGRAARD